MATKNPKIATIRMRKPHSKGQAELFNWPGSSVTFAGRRWGKTEIGTKKLVRGALTDPGLYWWVGLSWKSASVKRAWRLLKQLARNVYGAIGEVTPQRAINESNHEITLPNDSMIWMRSAENPESLAGEGIKGAVVDEFTLMVERVWTEYLEATLLDNRGWAFFVGVPKGKNWGANLYYSAATRSSWKQFHFTTYDNPFIQAQDVDAIKANLAEQIFRQEYLAEVVDDAGAVFRKVGKASTATPESKPEPHCPYVMGIDWGKHQDFTVISVFNARTRTQAFIDRFNQIDYQFQKRRVLEAYKRFEPVQVIAESNAMGEPLIDDLRSRGLPIYPFQTTNATKAEAVNAFALALEQENVTLLADDVQLAELQAFEMERLPSGLMRYQAPEGMHDDVVMADIIAWQGVLNAGAGRGQVDVFDSVVAAGEW